MTVCENLIIGGGLAGVTTALELLNHGKQVTLIDAQSKAAFGGQANHAFGGMLFVDTPIQRKNGIADSIELALSDWHSAAEFKESDQWGKMWANAYINHSQSLVFNWLTGFGIKFLPVVHWVERGDFRPGNSVPRYHIAWGCGRNVVQTLIERLEQHPNKHLLTLLFNHKVHDFELSNGRLIGCTAQNQESNSDNAKEDVRITAENIILACGGINGNLAKVKEVWDPCYGKFPDNILIGTHPTVDGLLHDKLRSKDCACANVINLNQMWNYAAGVRHPQPEFKHHGLSLIPPRSSLWMDCYGNRVGPKPMMTGFDTHDLCKETGALPRQYSWQVMNWKIAIKELAVSGTDQNPHIRDKNVLKLAYELMFGNRRLVQSLIDDCEDVVTANSLPELVNKMNALTHDETVSLDNMQRDIEAYDDMIKRGERFYNDDQLRKIMQVRKWRGDKVRTCKNQPILDEKAFPLIAIKSHLISRKSMGGFETNLQSKVLNANGDVIDNLYAVGEAAGFGGGGISGIRSLEGTFLSNCILNGRAAAHDIAGKKLFD
ncbi:FAD-binding dehydrogenase [Flocculibacter collagenilyticus]|uniref:FAD-binding dehydrogenase n=1 Tax=Flocculibacter collagenilyticus TaxID=2744479 RepID=UPI0018F51057|nr:FAD-binding dehydrogenase [Flocculibacter collagenilyticus]